ncbi:hypothetical protein [Cellulomonas fengjieae]|uniref:Integral membrane protein n=1 Tax=Cellulomonas fengjieae TaxID=2819978 RepID=A0ABS3SFY0_9CELL|nr:hypothetical protein [Cellulomonas fengjieae]MBO3084658.1 hypothetical protein [Cellulomonas fengjieae]QVI67018.1 hypothetical protein KG102_05365 [Cellulomonas fengjieae]
MTTVAPPTMPGLAHGLRRLYYARFGFAIAWAVLLYLTRSDLGPASVALLVLYPAVDAAAAVVDLRSSHAAGQARALYVNIAVSVLAAVGVAIACTSGVPAVLRVWGTWAVISGLVQLTIGVARRAVGGQWPMVLSGGLSVLVGAGFIIAAGADAPPLAGLAGYAALGGIFFLASALRLGRAAQES